MDMLFINRNKKFRTNEFYSSKKEADFEREQQQNAGITSEDSEIDQTIAIPSNARATNFSIEKPKTGN